MKPIVLDLTPSYYMVAILVIASVLAMTIIVLMPLPMLFKLVASLLIAAMVTFHVLRDALLVLPQSTRSVEVDAKHEFYVTNKSGNRYAATILASSFVASYLTVLNLKIPGIFWRWNVILLPDSANHQEFRQLRVWLKWHDQGVVEDVLEDV